jgi:hypothetical protein
MLKTRRAERKAGTLSAQLEKAQGRRSDTGTCAGRPTKSKALTKAGISREQAAQWEKLAAVPQSEFETALAGPDKPTTNGIINAAFPPKPRAVSSEALWLCGRLLDFERDGLLDKAAASVLETMTPEIKKRWVIARLDRHEARENGRLTGYNRRKLALAVPGNRLAQQLGGPKQSSHGAPLAVAVAPAAAPVATARPQPQLLLAVARPDQLQFRFRCDPLAHAALHSLCVQRIIDGSQGLHSLPKPLTCNTRTTDRNFANPIDIIRLSADS